jgi:hypothetical protein
MRISVGVVVGALASVVTWCGPQAAAQSDARKPPDTWCISEDKDSSELQISGCTNVIPSARESARSMENRRNAYHDEKGYDCAITDDDVAIKLNAPQPRNPDGAPIRRGSRIRCRAGAQTSSRTSPATRST